MQLFLFIKLLFCIVLLAQDALCINIPSGNALVFDGTTKVVLPEFTFGGQFTFEVWALANFSSRTGPLVYFSNEIDAAIDPIDGTSQDSDYEDLVELGIDVNGTIYLHLGVSDTASFLQKLPTSSVELDHILPHLTTDINSQPLVRRVSCVIPSEYSGRWVLIHVLGDSNGVISIYINKVLAFQTSSLDISVLPTSLARGINYIGGSPYDNFVGQIQSVALWSRAIATRDITGGTQKVYDGGLIGRWDFSYIENGVVLNQAADDKYSVQQKTSDLQTNLENLQKQIDAAQLALTTGTVDYVTGEKALVAAQQALAQARQVNGAYTGLSVTRVAPVNNQAQVTSIRATANSASVWDDPSSVSAQIANLTGATQERTTNSISDLAYIASKDNTDSNAYLKASLDSTNRLPYKSTNVNARSSLKTNLVSRSTSVSNAGSVTDRIDGTIVGNDGKKRSLIGLIIAFLYKLITKCSPEALDMKCTWCNDPHYTLQPVTGNWVSKYDYHSPSCHYILKVGTDILIQEQSYQCGSAGCISKVGAFVSGKWVVIFDTTGAVTVNGESVKLPYQLEDDISIINKDKKTPTLVVDGVFELFFSGSASLTFTSQQLSLADNRSICAQKGASGKLGPYTRFDIPDTECFLSSKWIPPTNNCPQCVNGRATFDLTRGCECECDSGWNGDLCDQYYCEQCAAPGGICTGANTCQCNTTDPVYVFGCSYCQCSCTRDYCYNGGTVSVLSAETCACSCPDGFLGDRCQNPRCPVGDNGHLCFGQGTCLANGTCQCITDVSFGKACEGNCSAQVCPSDSGLTCGGHGSCVCGKCVCNTDFSGDACSIPDCTNVTSTPDSQGCYHGTCVGTGDVPSCECNTDFSGARCTDFTCNPSCSIHGNCTEADPPYCNCHVGFTSADCGTITCSFLNDCQTPKGTCTLPSGNDTPACQCGDYWNGKDCSNPLCPNDCSNQGECIDSPAGSNVAPACKCQSPWIGDDCSTLPDCEVDLSAGNWSSPEWQARATEICSNSTYIATSYYDDCLFDARQIDNFEVLYSLAYKTYLECETAESQGGPSCGILCPNFCTFNGLCGLDGVCQCNPDFYGTDCSIQPNSRGYLFQYDASQQEAQIYQVVHAASPSTYLSIGDTGATTTSNEIANAVVVYLYQDYRPKYSECKPYNNLYLAVLVDKALSSCSQTTSPTFSFSVSFSDPSIVINQVSQCTASKTSTGYLFACSWKYGENAAVIIGPLSQNQSWAIDMALNFTGSCIDSVYYGSETITGTTDLVPITIADASKVTIVSDLINSKCGIISSCSGCMAAEGCGWCPDIGYCMDGTASGPLYSTCSVWRYDTDPSASRVVATSGYSNLAFPSNLDVYLVDGSPVDAYAYVLFPSDSMAIEIMFLVDVTSNMSDVVTSFGSQSTKLLTSIISTYPSSTAAISTFSDKPVSPYGNPQDYVYSEYLTMTGNATTFGTAVSALQLASGGDTANAQLEALLQVALRTSSGFTGTHRVVVIITGTPYHVPPLYGVPNNLDTTIDAGEDYPYVSDVRTALLNANVVPLFIVTDATYVANYTSLVQQIGFGVVRKCTGVAISDQVLSGLQEIFSTASLVASSTKFIKSIFPASYTSIQENSRVRFIVTLDRSALKRAELFDTTATLVAPGFGSVRLRLAKSDIPVGTDIAVSTKQNTKKTITLNGANIYNTSLTFKIATLPLNGSLLQYDGTPILSVGTEISDPLHRIIFVPAVNGSCQYQAYDYCSRRRNCYNPCPYATFQYELLDACAASSIRVNVSVDVIADLLYNRPVAALSAQPSTLQDTSLPIFLAGYDKDGDNLTSIISSLPSLGQLSYMGTTLTSDLLPYTVPNRTILYTPPYHRWGVNLDQFIYYVNDGKQAYQMGDSLPYTVLITVILTDHQPVVTDVTQVWPEGTGQVQTNLKVTDDDQIDFQRGDIHLYVLTVPTAAQGYLTQYDQTTVINAGDEVTDTSSWSVYFFPAIYGNYSFQYQAFDSQLYSNVANMIFNITYVNQPPESISDWTNSTLQGVPINITFPGWDREGDPFAFRFVNTDPALGSFFDIAGGGNVTVSTTKVYTLISNYLLFVPTTRTGDTVRFFYYLRGGGTYIFYLEVINVNDPPDITSSKTTYAIGLSSYTSTALTFSDLNINDVDSPNADFSVSIKLTGPGSIALTTNTSNLENYVHTSTAISFNARTALLNTTIKGLTYSLTTQSGIQSYTGIVLIQVDDNDATDPRTGNRTLTINTTVGSTTVTSIAATAGAVGAGAAAAIGLAGAYHYIKAKKLLPPESNPFASMGDDAVDVVLENPLYRQPSSN